MSWLLDTDVICQPAKRHRDERVIAWKRSRKAVAEFQVARPYNLALPGMAFFGFYGGLYPIYVRGEAYLAAHQGAEAAAEFQKILDNRCIAFADPVGALAHLQPAPAFVLMGDDAKAKIAYQDFLTLWKGADLAGP